VNKPVLLGGALLLAGLATAGALYVAPLGGEEEAAPEVQETASPTLNPTPSELTVSPELGPTGATVVLRGRNCGNPGQPTLISFGNQVAESGTGTIGAIELRDISTSSDGTFQTTFVIPAFLDPFQGRGGGAVVGGTYQFFSSPAACATLFTVTASKLPATGGSVDTSYRHKEDEEWLEAQR
jgi:hypothetical protein